MPEERNKWLQFKNDHKGLPVPRVIYADFECYLPKVSIKAGSQTEKYQKHVPSGFCYTVVSPVEKYCKEAVVYRSENVMDTFMDCMFKESNEEIIAVPMNLSVDEQDQF